MKTLLAEVFVEVLTGAVQHAVNEQTSLIVEKNLSQIKEINNNNDLSSQDKDSLISKENLKSLFELLPYVFIEKQNNRNITKLESLKNY